jgi:hypothetical protein
MEIQDAVQIGDAMRQQKIKARQRKAGMKNLEKAKAALDDKILSNRCIICKHPDREEIEAIYVSKKASLSLTQIGKLARKHVDENLTTPHLKTHFGLNISKKTGNNTPSHCSSDILVHNAEEAVTTAANRIIEEKAKEVSIVEISTKRKEVALKWLESQEGKEYMMDDKVGANMVKDAVQEDISRENLQIKRDTGNTLEKLFAANIGLMGAVFGQKQPKDYIDGEKVEDEYLPEPENEQG